MNFDICIYIYWICYLLLNTHLIQFLQETIHDVWGLNYFTNKFPRWNDVNVEFCFSYLVVGRVKKLKIKTKTNAMQTDKEWWWKRSFVWLQVRACLFLVYIYIYVWLLFIDSAVWGFKNDGCFKSVWIK